MSNVTVQEALKVAIEAMSTCDLDTGTWSAVDIALATHACKAALAEIEKCEPELYMAKNLHNKSYATSRSQAEARLFLLQSGLKVDGIESEVIPLCYCGTSPQPIKKCEPVAYAIRERDRLGFAVVNVIGKLDEIIEKTQEVEIDDFLHIAVPIDMWNELQAALEDMPKRADLYTSPQPRDWVVPSNEVIDTLWHKATHESVAYSEPFTQYRFSELLIKQLNTKG